MHIGQYLNLKKKYLSIFILICKIKHILYSISCLRKKLNNVCLSSVLCFIAHLIIYNIYIFEDVKFIGNASNHFYVYKATRNRT